MKLNGLGIKKPSSTSLSRIKEVAFVLLAKEAPIGLVASGITTINFQLDWDATDSKLFKTYRVVIMEGKTVRANISTTNTTYSAQFLRAGTTYDCYFYIVTGYGESEANHIQVTTPNK